MPPHAPHPDPGSHSSPTDKAQQFLNPPPDSQPQLLSTLGSKHVNSTEREVKTRASGERPSTQTPPRAGKVSAAGPSTCTAARAQSVLTCTTSMPRFLWRKSKKTQVTPAGSKYPSSTSTTASWRQGGSCTSQAVVPGMTSLSRGMLMNSQPVLGATFWLREKAGCPEEAGWHLPIWPTASRPPLQSRSLGLLGTAPA